MRSLLATLALAAVTMPAAAQQMPPHAGHPQDERPADPHAGHGGEPRPPASREHGASRHAQAPAGAPPDAAFAGPHHAADSLFDPAAMARARRHLRAEHGGMRAWSVLVDALEATVRDAGSDYAWEAQGWYGGDVNKLWIKTEGEQSFGEAAEEAEVQALWSRALTPWFDLQAGFRYDWRPEPERAHLALGIHGLMPYRFEVDAAMFLSEDGDLSVRLEAEYDLLLTQRLVLQPRGEVEGGFSDVPEVRVGSGFSRVELGLRLRYEAMPALAPYAGLEWERQLGQTADLARKAGERTNEVFVVAGVNFWF